MKEVVTLWPRRPTAFSSGLGRHLGSGALPVFLRMIRAATSLFVQKQFGKENDKFTVARSPRTLLLQGVLRESYRSVYQRAVLAQAETSLGSLNPFEGRIPGWTALSDAT